MRRRDLLGLVACGAAVASLSRIGASAAGESRVVAITAHKFAFAPEEVKVAKGTTLTLALTTTDFAHGFAIPDLGVRHYLIPGKIVELTFTAAKPGRFPYLCDNFCGEGHDGMSGMLVVQ